MARPKPPCEELIPVSRERAKAPGETHPLVQRAEGSAAARVGASPCASFQRVVDDYLVRHRSVLDVLSKAQESMARVNRAVVKAVTTCGCVQIAATAQQFPIDGFLDEVRNHMDTHLRGELCEHCRDVLDMELGRALFYLTAICNLFNMPLDDVITAEARRVAALGIYNLT